MKVSKVITTKLRNRLILELMAKGGMRIGEVLKLTPGDEILTTTITGEFAGSVAAENFVRFNGRDRACA